MKTILIVLLLTTSSLLGHPPPSDKEIIALTLLGEARGEGQAGMYAVACVIVQRSIERNLTPRKVCLQSEQFECWNPKKSLNHLLKSKSAPYALKLSESIVAGVMPDRKFVKYANHYCNLNCNPYWIKGIKPVIVIGKHKFYKLKWGLK